MPRRKVPASIKKELKRVWSGVIPHSRRARRNPAGPPPGEAKIYVKVGIPISIPSEIDAMTEALSREEAKVAQQEMKKAYIKGIEDFLPKWIESKQFLAYVDSMIEESGVLGK